MRNTAILLDSVQFIYEVMLAQLELQSFGIDFQITDELREFKLLNTVNLDNVIKRVGYFKMVDGKYTDYFRIVKEDITNYNRYLTHWIYPYKGKFHPQMIRTLLNIIGLKEGDIVLDPFLGSGTTAVEAKLLGINCLGVDISPFCVLLSKVKVESVEVIDEIEANKEDVLSKVKPILSNQDDKSFLEFVNILSNEKVSNFYKMVWLRAKSDNVRRKKDFEQSFYNSLDFMIKSVRDFQSIVKELGLKLGNTEITIGDARKLSIKDESIDGVITSPPYAIALDYVSNDAHSLKALGYELSTIREEFIGIRGKMAERINLYNQDMMKCYMEMYRVLKPEKFAVIIIGDATYSGQKIKTTEFTINYCQKIGFKLIKNIEKIIFGLHNVIQRENILIFKKIK